MYCDIDSYPSAFWELNPKAKKQHTCCECLSTIEKGERYHVKKGVWDGDFRQYKICDFCEQAGKKSDLTWCYGSMWETIGDLS